MPRGNGAVGLSHFNDDGWELYHTDTDRAELHDLAAEQPARHRGRHAVAVLR